LADGIEEVRVVGLARLRAADLDEVLVGHLVDQYGEVELALAVVVFEGSGRGADRGG